MSNLSSTVTPSTKSCTLEMKDGEISKIIELFNNDLVHVVDISVSLSNVSHGKELLSDFHVQLMNPIGREILFALDEHKTFQWTLRVGIRDLELNLLESQNGCIINKTNATEFTVETVNNIVRTINLATNYDVWYLFKEISSGEERKTCCHITKLNMLECNDDCSENNSYLFRSSFLWYALYYILCLVFLLCLAWIACDFVSRADFDVEYSKYYKLEESRMSPSFIFFKITWEEHGRVIACIRGCLLFIACLMYMYLGSGVGTSFLDVTLFTVYVLLAVAYVISLFLVGERPAPSPTELSNLKDERFEFSLGFYRGFFRWFDCDVTELWQDVKSCKTIGIVKVLTLLFNIKFWRKASKAVNQKVATFTAKHKKFNNRALKFLAVRLSCAFAVFIYFFFVVISVPAFLFLAFPTFKYQMVHSGSKLKYLWYGVIFLTSYFFVFVLLSSILYAIVPLLLGLFLNLVSFFPYLAFFSVLIFYCASYWKSMEEKYLLLKQLIYEACRDIKHHDHELILNRRLKRNEKVLPVVLRWLYDNIREKLLPYDENVFRLAVKLLCAVVFSFAIFQWIILLREFEVTGFVQVLTTASLSVMPRIFNMATLKTSEQMKEAWKEKMKLNVKYMVEKSVGKSSKRAMELVQTEVIEPWQESDEQILSQGMELFQKWTIDQEDGTKNEMTNDYHGFFRIPFQRFRKRKRRYPEHDTTNEMTDDNDQVNEERVELLQTEVMIHQEHDTINEMTDDNEQVNEERVELPQTGLTEDNTRTDTNLRSTEHYGISETRFSVGPSD